MIFITYLKKLKNLLYYLISRVLIGVIHLYQIVVSPFLGKHCRFNPSCSHYALEALSLHGSFKGSWLTLLRLLKCHPFHPGGVDLVPHQRIKR